MLFQSPTDLGNQNHGADSTAVSSSLSACSNQDINARSRLIERVINRPYERTHFNAMRTSKLEHIGWWHTECVDQERDRILGSNFEHGIRLLTLNVMREGQIVISICGEIRCVDTL